MYLMDTYINYRIFPLLLDINYNMRQNDIMIQKYHTSSEKKDITLEGRGKACVKENRDVVRE